MAKQINNVVMAVILAEKIMQYFDDVVKGLASDYAWYELVDLCHAYIEKQMTQDDLTDHLEMVFGIEPKAFKTIEKRAKTWYRHVEPVIL